MYKALHALLSTLLVYIAWLQLNDPDPLFWASLYLLAALVPLLQLISAKSCFKKYAIGIATGFCLAGIALVFSGATGYFPHANEESLIQDMSPDKPYIEEARELIGTLIALTIVLAYGFADIKSSKRC